jgi:hypothetical protein
MTYHQLGRTAEAQTRLRQLRDLMKDPEVAKIEQNQNFLHEAENLLATKPP